MFNEMLEYSNLIKEDLIELSEYIYNNPETGYEEVKSSKAHIDLLRKYDFVVEEGFEEIETAFKAVYKSEKPGPVISYLAEYDALPGIGHGCGHNILGTMSTGAGIVLKKYIDEVGGSVVVIGTPAEEMDGAKVIFARDGVFDEIDVSLMVHPEVYNKKSCDTLALEPIDFIFHGKAAHSATSPEKGINALDACIQTFNNINALREHMLDSARVHGIITNGGSAANVVPDLASAQFYIRTTKRAYREELKEKVINCAKAGALATGATLEILESDFPFDNVVSNEILSSRFTENHIDAGADNILESSLFPASVDMGNVSHVCPAIHAFVKITEKEDLVLHTEEFREETLTSYAYDAMIKAVYALAKTGFDVCKDKILLENIKEEFNSNK